MTVDQRMRTNIPGVFGAGDFITYGSKVRLIAGAFNDAVLAVNSAKMYLEPAASDMAGVSSHNARFFEKTKLFPTGRKARGVCQKQDSFCKLTSREAVHILASRPRSSGGKQGFLFQL